MSKTPTPAQYQAIDRAAYSQHGGVWPDYGIRRDVIERCKESGWLHRWDNDLTALGDLAWLNGGLAKTDAMLQRVMGRAEERAYRDADKRKVEAERIERNRAMYRPPTGMTFTFTFNEWFAISNALGHTSETYRPDTNGVVLHELRGRIEDKYREIAERHNLKEED